MSQPLGDTCMRGLGPRNVETEAASPATLTDATREIDEGVDGTFCGVPINTPGVWYWIVGTGNPIRASTCHEKTDMKVKISVFSGPCTALQCVTGSDDSDYECDVLTPNDDTSWNTIATAVDFPTVEGQRYNILVQQLNEGDEGTVWMYFREPNLPPNDECITSVGPLPRDNSLLLGSTADASPSADAADSCTQAAEYPGVWYQVMGTGGPIQFAACGETNFLGFFFKVYNGANCDSKTCVEGTYDYTEDAAAWDRINLDQEKCIFGPAELLRPVTTYTFDTNAKDRYYIYIYYATTNEAVTTGDFRLYVDDGANGDADLKLFERPATDRNSAGMEDLGMSNWDRFNPQWSLTVNDQCLYEFTFEFQHDDTLPMGTSGFEDVCAFQDPDTKLPFLTDDGGYYLTPRQHWERFPDYVWAATGFQHMSLDWHACGHLPKGYSLPHYDFSFFRVPPEYRAFTMTCETLNENQVVIPGDQICTGTTSEVQGMGMFVVPSYFWDPIPVVNMPRTFTQPTSGIGPKPHIGLRAWDQDIVPSFPNEWEDLPLFMSTYAGDLVMWQAQVPYRDMSGNENKFKAGSAQYHATTIQTLPDTYSVEYHEPSGRVRFTIVGKSHLCKNQFEQSKAVADGTNDDCSGALEFGMNERKQAAFDVATADNVESCNEKDYTHGVWYTVVGNGNIVTMSTCSGTTQEPTTISIFSGGCNSLSCSSGQIRQLPTCDNTDVRLFLAYSVSWIANVGETYHVFLAGEVGTQSYSISSSDIAKASNTNCESAIFMGQAGQSPFVQGNTVGSATSNSCDNNRSAVGVWYVVQSGSIPSGASGTLLSASTCSDSTSFYSFISVYSGGNCDGLTCASDVSYLSCTNGVTAQWTSTTAESFYIFVHSSSAASTNNYDAGFFELSVTEAAAADNDQCAENIVMSSDGTSVVGTTVGARSEELASDCDTPLTGGGVWYSVAGTGTGLSASTCFDETDHDTAIHVFSGECDTLTCIEYEGESFACGGQRKGGQVNWISEVGKTYYILVSGKDGDSGSFTFSVTEFEASNNNKCSNADSSSLVLDGTYSVSGDTHLATRDFSTDEFCGVPIETPGVWYTVAGTGKGFSATICPENPTFKASISVFRGGCDALECVVGSDNVVGNDFETCLAGEISIAWMGEAGVTYYIYIHGDIGGKFNMKASDFEVVRSNDFCAEAESISNDGTIASGTVADANVDYMFGTAFCGTFIQASGVWFKVEGTGGVLELSACSGVESASVTATIFSGTCDKLRCERERLFSSPCASTSEAERSLQNLPSTESTLWFAESGETYYILVHGQSPNTFATTRAEDFDIGVAIPEEGTPIEPEDICQVYTDFIKKDGDVCECDQSDERYEIKCVDPNCAYCNAESTVCHWDGTLGIDVDGSGQLIQQYQSRFFVGARSENVTVVYDAEDNCETFVDGVKCNSCKLIECPANSGSPSNDGIVLDCENIESGALVDSCAEQAEFAEGSLLEYLNSDEFGTCINKADVSINPPSGDDPVPTPSPGDDSTEEETAVPPITGKPNSGARNSLSFLLTGYCIATCFLTFIF